MQIGPYSWSNQTALAPMAGVTDRPFRQLCRRLGAAYVVSEMVSSRPDLRKSRKTLLRSDHNGEATPIAVQIVGTEPDMMAEAARYNVRQGAQIIDINMGCPAKKVCNKLAGSALLADPDLVQRILHSVVAAVDVPVSLKIRTGQDETERNAVAIARLAEQAGIQALAVHGRTRRQMYRGVAEYDTIRAVKQAVNIPVIANGDIDSPGKARQVLDYTGADAVMIGRAAHGRPWIFREINHFLASGRHLAPPGKQEIAAIMLDHVRRLHRFYGKYAGIRIARKHIGWYLADLAGGPDLRRRLMPVESAQHQLELLIEFFNRPESLAA